MAYAWSFDVPSKTFTLTLDGTGSGQKSRSHTFTVADGITADALHTFYLTVDPSVVAVGAFLSVEGGDTTVADATGAQILRARGTADGSANLTVHFGAQLIEAAPGSGSSDGLNYANIAALEAAGWSKIDTHTGSPVWSIESSNVTEGAHALKVVVGAGSGETYYKRTIPGFTPGESVSFSVDVYQDVKHWWENTTGLYFGGGGQVTYSSPAGTYKTLTLAKTADGSGNIEVRLRVGTISRTITVVFDNLRWSAATGGGATIDYRGLTYCLGSGTSETGGTGLGQGATDDDPGNDTIPDPPAGGYPAPPVGGARPFGGFDIPPDGLGYLNSTVKQMNPTWLPNLLNTASTASTTLWLTGRWKLWLDASGKFSYDLWKADIDEIYNDPVAGPALLAAIASGVAKAHYVIDEPFHPTRYGGPLSLATVEKMCLYSKSLWPTWPTAIRVKPTDSHITRHINGLDWLWAQYTTLRGDITAYRDNEIARAQELGHGLVVGLNIADFLGKDTRPITPDELRHYGGILAASSVPVAFVCWRYETGLYAQSGFPEALRYVRDIFASYDP